MNKGGASLGQRSDSGTEGKNTYLFGCAVLKEVEGARGSYYSSIVERCRVY
jgi:hypothetical protein